MIELVHTYLSSVVEKKAASAISVLSISWIETLLTYQSCLLVTNTLVGGGGGRRKPEMMREKERRE